MLRSNWNVWLPSGKSFAETYPNVEKAILEVIETGEGTRAIFRDKPWGYNAYSLEEILGIIPCSNPECSGGPSCFQQIDDAISKGMTEYEFYVICSGKTKHDECMNGFKAILHVAYRK